MASATDPLLPKKSDDHQEGESSNPRNSASARIIAELTESAPPLLETFEGSPSSSDAKMKQTFRKKKFHRSQQLPISRADSIYSEERVAESISRERRFIEQQMNRLVVESDTRCYSPVTNCYKNWVMKIRNSNFMYALQIVFACIPISSIVMGTYFSGECPIFSFMAVFSAIMGFIGAILNALWICKSYRNRRRNPFSNLQTVWFGVYCIVFFFSMIFEAGFALDMSPSFDASSTKYCNETFYMYIYYKEYAIGIAAVLLLILYLPELCQVVSCHDCSTVSALQGYYDSI